MLGLPHRPGSGGGRGSYNDTLTAHASLIMVMLDTSGFPQDTGGLYNGRFHIMVACIYEYLLHP